MDRSLPETPPHSAHLVRGSLADDDLWDLVVATVTESVALNRFTKVDIEWLVAVDDDCTSGDPTTGSTCGRPIGLVLVADEQTAIDDTVVVMVGTEALRRIPVDEAAWTTFLHLIDDDDAVLGSRGRAGGDRPDLRRFHR
jgi:hypothetical protein